MSSEKPKIDKKYLRISKKVYEGIWFYHPSKLTEEQMEEKIQEGAKILLRLEKQDYSLNELEKCFEWALGNDFYNSVFKSIPALLIRKKNGNTKLDNMIERYTQSQFMYKHDHRVKTILYYAKGKYNYNEENLKDLEEDIHWFYLKIDEINDELKSGLKLNWMNNSQFVEIGHWLVDIENQIIPTDKLGNFKDIMIYYLRYLKKGLQRGKPDKLYPSLFSDKSFHFKAFLNDLSDEWETDILSTQE